MSGICPNISLENVQNDAVILDQVTTNIYVIACPILAAIGIIGNSLSLLTSYHQSRNDKAYYLQCVVMISDLLSNFGNLLYDATLATSTSNVGPNWLRKNFTWMWFMVTFGVPISDMFVNSSMLVVLFTTLDRIQVNVMYNIIL